NVAVPVMIWKVTDCPATGLPLASVITARTLLVPAPSATAPVVTTSSRVVGTATLGVFATKSTWVGLPLTIGVPSTSAVISTGPATVLVSMITASPLASVVTVKGPGVAVPLAIVNITVVFATGFPLA